jgi:hypothetical protein
MSKPQRSRITGEPVTYRLPAPAGGVRLETFVPWTLVKRGAKKAVVTPLDAPEAFVQEAGRSARPGSLRSTRHCCGPWGWPITGTGCWTSSGWRLWSRLPRLRGRASHRCGGC